jgi:hypothetical protein
MILQFPPEILCTILAHIEPIWLFQLEEAHPTMATLLSTQRANKIWYELLPPALLSEPEYFQDEIEVAKILKAYRKAGLSDKIVLPDSSEYKLR